MIDIRIQFAVNRYYKRGSHYYEKDGYRIRMPRRFASGLMPSDYKFAITSGDHSSTTWLYWTELVVKFPWVKVKEL